MKEIEWWGHLIGSYRDENGVLHLVWELLKWDDPIV